MIVITSLCYAGALQNNNLFPTIISDLIEQLQTFLSSSVFMVDHRSSFSKRLVLLVSKFTTEDNSWKKQMYSSLMKNDRVTALNLFDLSKEADRQVYKECIYESIKNQDMFS